MATKEAEIFKVFGLESSTALCLQVRYRFSIAYMFSYCEVVLHITKQGLSY